MLNQCNFVNVIVIIELESNKKCDHEQIKTELNHMADTCVIFVKFIRKKEKNNKIK